MSTEEQILLTPVLLVLSMAVVLSGCTHTDHMVLSSTGTVIGVDISQDPATQSPHAKLGYNRGELAIVPTNRPPCVKDKNPPGFQCAQGDWKGGAKDTTDVLMELRYGGIFDTGGSSGIYQRLAVGNTAVRQPGAAFMFAKDENGTLDAVAAIVVASTLDPEALVTVQKNAIETLCQKVLVSGKTDEPALKDFFSCAGFNKQNEIDKLAAKFKDKTFEECQKDFAMSDYASNLPDWVLKCK